MSSHKLMVMSVPKLYVKFVREMRTCTKDLQNPIKLHVIIVVKHFFSSIYPIKNLTIQNLSCIEMIINCSIWWLLSSSVYI